MKCPHCNQEIDTIVILKEHHLMDGAWYDGTILSTSCGYCGKSISYDPTEDS